MENYIVSARKYRPATFADVVGQHALTVTLKNAIATDRLAHAYLFCGSRGVGKTSCARIFAKTINCQHRRPDGEACNECESCRQFNENRSLNIIELDAASHNGIDDMRSLIEQVMMPPTSGRYRVFIIDEVHMLSSAAFNAFLKTLEEPPHHVIFVLATTEKHKIIPTILSRCQIYDFNRIGVQDTIDHLARVAQAEGYTAEPEALGVIAERADGAMRDALSIFDQVAASSMGHITYQAAIDSLGLLDKSFYARLVDAFIAGDVRSALLIYDEVRRQGFDSQQFINGLGQYLRDLMVAGDPSTIKLLEAGDTTRAEMAERAARCTPDFLYRAMGLCNDADLNYRMATNKQFLVELTLIRLCQAVSPSSDNSGKAEGQLQPIAASSAPQPATQQPQQQPIKAATPPPAVAPRPVIPKPAPPQPQHHAAEHLRQAIGPQISIRGIGKQPEPKSEAAQPAVTEPTPGAAYTRAQLDQAWDAFIEANPTEVILINTMSTARPQPTDRDHVYSVLCENDIQAAMVAEHLPQLLDFMRKQLSNNAFDITLTVNHEQSSNIMTWSDLELLRHLLDESPQLKSFYDDFQLKLL